MASEDDIATQIEAADGAAKLALLQAINRLSSTTSHHYLERLAHAYALVKGAAPGKLPGGFVEPTK